MSDTDTKDSSVVDWIEQSIANGRTKYYESSGFENFEPIGKGSVVRANWKNTKNIDRFVVLKSFKNEKIILKEIINEVKYFKIIFLKKKFFLKKFYILARRS